jgi:hypothetical protein
MAQDLFRFDSPRSIEAWSPVDDAVMGGVSFSRLRYDDAGYAVFEGRVSLENNGGFASVRSAPADLGAANVRGYMLEARGDGKRYKLNLRTDDFFDGINYQAVFDAPAGTWATIHLPLAQFHASCRGRPVPGAPALDPRRVRQAGLLIGDRQTGDFSLSVRTIRAE